MRGSDIFIEEGKAEKLISFVPSNHHHHRKKYKGRPKATSLDRKNPQHSRKFEEKTKISYDIRKYTFYALHNNADPYYGIAIKTLN